MIAAFGSSYEIGVGAAAGCDLFFFLDELVPWPSRILAV
jgi:hypothetical protein